MSAASSPGRWVSPGKQLSSLSRSATRIFDGPGRWVRQALGAKPLSVELAEPQLPSSPMKPQASRAEERALDGCFVNYADAAKSYDCARETLGCDLILGVTLSSPQRMQCKLSLSHHARTPRAHTTEDTEPLSALLLLSINYHVPPRRGQVRWPCRQ